MSLTLKQLTPLLAALLGIGMMAGTGQAQSITSASDGTGTIVTPDGNRFDIHGGSLSGDGANLFHSFEKFGLSQEQIATFLSNPQIQNILGRVVGGDASLIDGLIQVTGGNSNLFMMNPSGFIFGNNAQLNVPTSFTATTANGIQFGDRWFNASGINDHADLVGNPSGFAFTMAEPGTIINTGDLAVKAEQSLSLLGGTVASTGQLSAPEGEIIVTAVPGESLVRLSMPGNVLGIEIDPTALGGSQPNEWNLPIAALPDLLTVGAIEQDTELAVNPEGQVTLADSETPIAPGDVTVQDLAAQSAVLSANQNLTLVESQLTTSGDLQLLAQDTVRIRDSETKPFLAQAGENLYIQGNQNIDILALNRPETPFQSGGDLTLVSDGNISGDSHFASGGNFSLLNLKGEPGNFLSEYDPIITALGDVEFGDYTGVALKVEAIGSIEGGDIEITGPDENLSGSDSDIPTLTSSPALILRSGVPIAELQNRPDDSRSAEGTNFNLSNASSLQQVASSLGEIKVGNIDTSSEVSGLQDGGPVILSAPGDIEVSTINTQGASDLDENIIGNGGDVTIRTLSSFRATEALSTDVLNIGEDIDDNVNEDDGISITTQGGRSGSARGGKIDITIADPNFLVVGQNISFNPDEGSGTIGRISNSPEEPDSSGRSNTGPLPFPPGGAPTPGNAIDDDSSSSGVTNTVSPTDNFGLGNTQGQIALNLNNDVLQANVLQNTPQEEELAAIEEGCEPDDELNEQAITSELEAICTTKEASEEEEEVSFKTGDRVDRAVDFRSLSFDDFWSATLKSGEILAEPIYADSLFTFNNFP